MFLAFPFTISKKSSKLKNKFISKYDINLSGSHFFLLHKLRSISNLSIFVLFHLSKSQPKSILLDGSHIHFLKLMDSSFNCCNWRPKPTMIFYGLAILFKMNAMSLSCIHPVAKWTVNNQPWSPWVSFPCLRHKHLSKAISLFFFQCQGTHKLFHVFSVLDVTLVYLFSLKFVSKKQFTWQEYKWSWSVRRNLSLNWKANGNCSSNCQTPSKNCKNTGEVSFPSDWRNPHLSEKEGFPTN